MTPIERAISILIQTGDSVKPFWEGIILKKSSKKIAAVLTLAAFVLTLVPMAAFAANTDAQASSIYTVDKDAENANVDVATGTVDVKIDLKDASGVTATDAQSITVWAEDAQGNVSSAFEVKAAGAVNATVPGAANDGTDNLKYGYDLVNVKNNAEVKVAFKRAGTYTIHAAITAPKATKVEDLEKLQTIEGQNKIVAVEPTTDATKMTVNGTAIEDNIEKDMTANLKVKANGLEQKTLDFVVMNKDGKALPNKEIKLSTSSSYAVLDKKTVTTDSLGKASVKYSATRDGSYVIYADVDTFNGKIKVTTTDENGPEYITTSKTPKAPFANKTGVLNEDDIQFDITDKNNVEIDNLQNQTDHDALANDQAKQGTVTNEPAFDVATANHKDYVKVTAQPTGSKLDGSNFVLVRTSDYKAYTLKTTSTLKEGKYTVKVGLLSGKTAEVSFEVKAFGTPKEMKINFDAETVALGAIDQKPTSVKLIDENGVQRIVDKASDEVTYGYDGYAAYDFDGNVDNKFQFSIKDDEKYLGQKVTFTAVSKKYGLTAVAEVVVGQDGKSIKFNDNAGKVDQDNTVVGQIVDGKDKTVALGKKLTTNAEVVAYVVKSSNPEAKVNVEAKDKDLENKGTVELTLTSNKATTAEIAVYVKDGNGRIYANTLTYTFGAKSDAIGKSVVMTISSKDSIVNNKIVSIDAAPYIKMNRTFVPIRALAEDFGAKVDWNEKDQKVTVELEGNKVVMTIGSKDYTINGEKKTMDVAPEIMKDRTFVPVRFVAESLGFTVTPTYNNDGTTANVVFTK